MVYYTTFTSINNIKNRDIVNIGCAQSFYRQNQKYEILNQPASHNMVQCLFKGCTYHSVDVIISVSTMWGWDFFTQGLFCTVWSLPSSEQVCVFFGLSCWTTCVFVFAGRCTSEVDSMTGCVFTCLSTRRDQHPARYTSITCLKTCKNIFLVMTRQSHSQKIDFCHLITIFQYRPLHENIYKKTMVSIIIKSILKVVNYIKRWHVY